MHLLQLIQQPGDTAPDEQFGRIARTLPAQQSLTTAAADSAKDANVCAIEDDALKAVVRRTLGASGFGDAALDSVTLHAAARRHGARATGDLLSSILRGVVARIRAWHLRYRRRVDAQAIYRDLAQLDSRCLRDLGIHHRGELRFIAQRLAHGEDLHTFHGHR